MASLVYYSCKKLDSVLPKTEKAQTTEEAFFDQHRSTAINEKIIVNYLKRQNDQLHFVEKKVQQIGYPYWNKSIAVPYKNKNATARNPQGDSSTLYYIPFVRDSQYYVNAAMVINATATDTSFWYVCDWQYKSLSNDSANIQIDKAEQLALLLMKLDVEVFGHKKFTIKDTTLFNNGDALAKKVQFDTAAPTAVNNLNYIFQCTNIAITVRVECDFGRTIQVNRDVPVCEGTQWVMLCWYELDIGDPPGSGGGTGGGNPNGGGTPPECGGAGEGIIAGRGNLPCIEDPGWEPELPELPLDDYDPYIADTVIIDTSISNNYP